MSFLTLKSSEKYDNELNASERFSIEALIATSQKAKEYFN
jgi:hypothetical protein